jgi:hypothetical protein
MAIDFLPDDKFAAQLLPIKQPTLLKDFLQKADGETHAQA